jgi:hypothetical protein
MDPLVRSFVRLGLIVALLGIVSIRFTHADGEQPASPPPSASLIPVAVRLHAKFDGSASCSFAGACHGDAQPSDKRTRNHAGNEFTLWSGKDPHRTAYRTLVKPKSKEIAARLKIDSAVKSERCLSCHTTFIPAQLKEELAGDTYSAAEGVSCGSCHGPKSKCQAIHIAEGWIDTERAKGDHNYLLNTWGLYDTRPAFQRAARCASCHLCIGPELLEAGHPPLTFEMNHFSSIYPSRHWQDPAGSFPAELWANGQLAELHDALLQVSLCAMAKPAAVEEFRKAYNQAMAHFWVFYTVIQTKVVVSPDAAMLGAEIQKLADAMIRNDLAGAGAAARAAAEQSRAKGLSAAVAQWKPDKGAAAKVLAAVVNSDLGKTFGTGGQEQQAYAIEALAQAAGDEAILKAVLAISPSKVGETGSPEEFARWLAELRAKLPK